MRLWTDGCCLSNPGGPGGWAVVAERRGNAFYQLTGREESTTNNRMELQAVIQAVEIADGKTEVISDSTYVVNGITKWLTQWKRLGWRRGSRRIKNEDLWKELDDAINSYSHPLRFRWVKGHAGGRFNEMADELASEAARHG